MRNRKEYLFTVLFIMGACWLFFSGFNIFRGQREAILEKSGIKNTFKTNKTQPVPIPPSTIQFIADIDLGFSLNSSQGTALLSDANNNNIYFQWTNGNIYQIKNDDTVQLLYNYKRRLEYIDFQTNFFFSKITNFFGRYQNIPIIQKYSPSGTFISEFICPTNSRYISTSIFSIFSNYFTNRVGPQFTFITGDIFGNIYVDWYIYGNCLITKYNNTWNYQGTILSNLINCTDIDITKNNYLYILDNDTASVRKYDINGIWLLYWGGSGTANGKFSYIWEIDIDQQGYVYINDSGNVSPRIQVFDQNGNFKDLLNITINGANNFIAVSKDDNIYISSGNKIKKYHFYKNRL